MGILVDHQIKQLCEAGMVRPYSASLLNPASLDVRLGDQLLIESKDSPELQPYSLETHSQESPYWLQPGAFVLAQTLETFHLPEFLSAQFALKSSRAREGLEHLMAGYCDPGWYDSVLTLELQNVRRYHPIALWPGMKIGQMVFHRLDSRPARSYVYTGRYNNNSTVTGSKG